VTGLFARRHAAAHRLRAARDTLRRPRRCGQRVMLVANLVVMAVLLGAPIAVLVAKSFDTSGGPGFGYYDALGSLHRESVLFVSPLTAIRHSLEIAVVSTLIALTVGGLAAAVSARGRRGIELLVALPLGVSAVILGFGMLVAFDEPPLDLRASWIILPVAHALVAVPFVVQIVAPVLSAIDPRLRETAAVLGASPRRVWREVDLPIASRALLVAAGFCFAISLGEFGATAFLVRPDRPTLPVEIYRLLGQPGELNFGAAMAGSVLLMAVTTCAVLAVDRFRAGPVGTF
jgi:thiamine transport system permease protein